MFVWLIIEVGLKKKKKKYGNTKDKKEEKN